MKFKTKDHGEDLCNGCHVKFKDGDEVGFNAGEMRHHKCFELWMIKVERNKNLNESCSFQTTHAVLITLCLILLNLNTCLILD